MLGRIRLNREDEEAYLAATDEGLDFFGFDTDGNPIHVAKLDRRRVVEGLEGHGF